MSAPVMVELSAEDRLRAWERSCPAWVVSITGIIATAYDADTKIKVFGRTADEVARRWQSQSTTSAVPSVLSAHGVCGVLGRDWTRTVSADLRNPGTSADPRNAAALPNTPRRFALDSMMSVVDVLAPALEELHRHDGASS